MTDAPIAFPSNRPEPCAFHLAYDPTCGACVRTNKLRPEYTADQVAESTARLAKFAECGDRTIPVILYGDVPVILSALSTAESEIKRLTLQVDGHDPYSSNPAETCVPMVDYLALRSRLESAERDTARIEWLESHAGLVAGDLTPETLCRDAAFGWVKVPRFGDPQRALRDAIDAAHSRSTNQGETNG